MNRRIITLLTLLATAIPLPLQAAVSIFACEPEWAVLAKIVGGNDVRVFTATTSLQNQHYFQTLSLLIDQVREADLVFCTGAEYEKGWLPLLLRQAQNPGVQPGRRGYLAAADHVTRLEVPGGLDPDQGNPHIRTQPHNLLTVARVLADRLVLIDTDHADDYRSRIREFEYAWRDAIRRWERQGDKLRGKRVVVHRKEWIYLLDWLGMERVAALEPKSGTPPSAEYLDELKQQLEAEPADFIIRSPLLDEQPSKWLSQQLDVPVAILPLTVQGSEDATDLYAWFDTLLQRLLDAAG